MPYDHYTAERIRQVLEQKRISYEEKKMMGGLCFMVDDKMCCGIHFHKKANSDLLIVRIGKEQASHAIDHHDVLPVASGRTTMTDFAFVKPACYDTDQDLEKWLQLAIDFNPLAKSSKKKKPPPRV